MIKIGVKDRTIYDNYLASSPCRTCQRPYENKLTISCNIFFIGNALLPVVLWAWGKKAFVRCHGCGAMTVITYHTGWTDEIVSIYNKSRIPFYFFAPAFIVALVLSNYLINTTTHFVADITTSTDEKLQGKWEAVNAPYTLYVFDQHQYTLINENVVAQGNVAILSHSHREDVDMGHLGKVHHLNTREMSIVDGVNDTLHFMKSSDEETGENPYQPRYNRWRVRAKSQEDSLQLRARVINYLTHMKVKYEWAIENQMSVLSGDSVSPMIMASNGIAINQNSLLNWYDIFNSYEEWRKANEILLYYFPSDFVLDEREKNVFRQNLRIINAHLRKLSGAPGTPTETP
jgi:hypothetical protein